jgi:hypothetical protein
MKRLILSFLAVAVLIFAYDLWMREPDHTRPVPVSTGGAPHRGIPASAASIAATPSSPIQGESRAAMTEKRELLFDSPDLMKTLKEIRKTGSQDEKDWGAFILAVCTNVRATNRMEAAEVAAASAAANSVAASKERELQRERRQAFERLKARCAGIFDLTPEERSGLKSDLIANSSTNTSVLGRLHALATSSDDRWNHEQLALITNSLYSNDPVVQREAYFALHVAIDRDAPGGADRSDALDLAFPPVVVSGSLSNLESMAACYVIKMCSSNQEQRANGTNASRAVERLATEYKAALSNHSDARSILAIR